MRVASPAKQCVEIDAPSGLRYNFRNGIQDVTKRDARAIVAYGGFIPSMAGTRQAGVGFLCPNCDFGSYFKTCSRCGSECVREAS